MMFGEYLRGLRLERSLTLRTLCAEAGLVPGNYSKMERGLVPAPKNKAKLESYRKALSLAADSTEWKEVLRLASLSRGEIPHGVLSDRDLSRKLPALFRFFEGETVDEETINELVATLRGSGASRGLVL